MTNYQSFQNSAGPSFAAIDGRSPYRIPGSHTDVYNSLAAKNEASLNASRNQALTDFQNERLAAQQNSALTGLQNLMQARRQEMDMANQKNAMRLGVVNSILSGLYR